jgi:Cu+-exporting ATPase
MNNDYFIKILLAASLVFGLVSQPRALAEMNTEKHHHHQDMQSMSSIGEDEAVASIKTDPEQVSVGTPTTIVFSIKDRLGRPLTDLTIHHDRLIHVVIASQDFSVFSHIHPQDFGPITSEMKKTAQYHVRFTFPKAGRYIIGIDFAVKGQPISKHFVVNVTGEPQMGPPKKDFSREKRFEGLDVKFATMPERITAGNEVTLSYLFKNNGKQVTDLEPWLSAPMHLAIISGDLTHFIHTHGEVRGMPTMGHHEHNMKMDMSVPKKFGPNVEVHVVFPAKGLYQIFGQVGYHGKVIPTSFMVEAE